MVKIKGKGCTVCDRWGSGYLKYLTKGHAFKLFSENVLFLPCKGKCLAQVQDSTSEARHNKPKTQFKSCRSPAQSLYHPDSLYKQNHGMLSPLSLVGVKLGSPEA